MKESKLILNVQEKIWSRAKEIEIPDDHKIFKALDDLLEVILLGPDIYRCTDHAVAFGNRWSDLRQQDTSFFMATEWHRFAKGNNSPTGFNGSFTNFLLRPDLLIVSGLSYMKTRSSRESLDTVLDRRQSEGKRNLITGWNMPEGDFRFEVGQELAIDSRSEFPLLHQRSGQPNMTLLVSLGEK